MKPVRDDFYEAPDSPEWCERGEHWMDDCTCPADDEPFPSILQSEEDKRRQQFNQDALKIGEILGADPEAHHFK